MRRLLITGDSLQCVSLTFSSHQWHVPVSARHPFSCLFPPTFLCSGMLPETPIASFRYSFIRLSTLSKGVQDGGGQWSSLSHALDNQFNPIFFLEGQHATVSHVHSFRERYTSKRDVEVAADIISTSGNHIERASKGHSFSDALRVLESRISKVKKLNTNSYTIVNRLLDRLNMRPILERMRFVHIAGTKGKGTTAAYTASLLQAYGYRVGLFTSPHLIDVRERILVNNLMLSREKFACYLFEIHEQLETLKHSERDVDRDDARNLNYFSFLFLLCLHVFAAEHVEIAIMEVGIGGRKDATNVIPSEVSVITSLGYDHMELLGNTIQSISHEKAAIMRPDVVCFASPQRDHPEVRSELEGAARAARTPFMFLDDTVFPIKNWPRLAIGGDHAIEDSKLAFMAARQIAGIPPVLPLDKVELGVLCNMQFAGRSHIIPFRDSKDCVFYLDGAHTVESLERATKWFLEASAISLSDTRTFGGEDVGKEPRRVLLFFTLRDPRCILKAFMPFVSKFCKAIIAQVPIMKPESMVVATQTAASTDVSDLTEDDTHANVDFSQHIHERLVVTTESWRELYREVPCLPCMHPFDTIEDLLNLVVPATSDNEDASKVAQVFVSGSFYIVSNVLQLIENHAAERHRM